MPQLSSDGRYAELLGLHADVQPQTYWLESEICTIGRFHTCQIVVLQSLVSRLHARIERSGPRYILYDTNSANGTFVNGSRIHEPYLLQDDDLIGLGSPAELLRFLDPDPTFRPTARLRYDEHRMIFFLKEHPLDLSKSQFLLLNHLYQRAGTICTRESCAEALWGREYDPGMDASALDEAIRKLRAKLREVDPEAELIKSRRGIGYELEL
jgi:DNA-binding response OmpR family regulator